MVINQSQIDVLDIRKAAEFLGITPKALRAHRTPADPLPAVRRAHHLSPARVRTLSPGITRLLH